MLVGRDDFKKGLENAIMKWVPNPSEQRTLALTLYKKYKIPPRISMEIMKFTKDIDELGGSKGDFVAYCILERIGEQNTTNLTAKIFTENEIRNYQKITYPDGKEHFPIKIICYPVADDQWIGTISIQRLVGLGRSDLIRYDADTQRVMKRIVKGENIFYRINLVKSAVSAIGNLLKEGKYIPNTITLNIPLGEGDFYYDTDKGYLIISSLEAFNIIDGYHRYMAFVNVLNENESFDFNTEIRITNFDTDKANTFIWQEDQKNRMVRADSNTYNPNNLANRIIKRINDSSISLVNGMVVRNGGIIDPSDLLPCIEYLYLKEKPENETQALVKISSRIIERLNSVIESNYNIIDEKLNFEDIVILFYLISNEDIKEEQIYDTYVSMKSEIPKEDEKKFYTRQFNKRMYTYIQELQKKRERGENCV